MQILLLMNFSLFCSLKIPFIRIGKIFQTSWQRYYIGGVKNQLVDWQGRERLPTRFFFEIRDSPIQFHSHATLRFNFTWLPKFCSKAAVESLGKNDVQGLVDICVLMEADSGFVGIFFRWQQDEAFLEDINMILNTGDVPNVYESDEKAEITEQVTASKYINTEIYK